MNRTEFEDAIRWRNLYDCEHDDSGSVCRSISRAEALDIFERTDGNVEVYIYSSDTGWTEAHIAEEDSN